eukprot:m51a1_g4869 hypothetical protein (406) ;mRNA; r:353809-359912
MEGGADGVPQLSAGSVLRATVARTLCGWPIRCVALLEEQRQGGPFVLQVLRQTPSAWPYALSDGCHYWWCEGQSPETLPHGAVVQCETLLWPSPESLRLLYGPVAVVGRPIYIERCPEVASLGEVFPGSEQQELRLGDLEKAGRAFDFAVCRLFSPNNYDKDTGIYNIRMRLFYRGSIAPATGPAVMAEMLGLPEAALDWRTRRDIMNFITAVLDTTASWLSIGPLQLSLAFDWEEDPPISVEWIVAKRVLDAAICAVPALCRACCGPLVPVEVRYKAIVTLRAVFRAVGVDETARGQHDQWHEEATTVLLASHRRVGDSSPLALLDVATLRAILMHTCSECQAARHMYRSAMFSLVSSRVCEPPVHLPPRGRQCIVSSSAEERADIASLSSSTPMAEEREGGGG